MSNRYGLYSAFFDAGATGLALNQLRSIGTRTQKQILSIHPSGSIDPSVHVMSSARPVMQFGSRDLATIFGAATPVSITAGLYCSDASTFMYRRRVAGGAYSSAAEHLVQTVRAGFLHCSEISADAESQDGAQATLEFVALSVDGRNPFTITDDQSIPGALTAPAYNSVFYHGPAYINGVQLPGLISTRVRPGIDFRARIADGGTFPLNTLSSISARRPMIELSFLKLDMLDSVIGALTTAAFSTTLATYWWRGSNNGEGRVAAATASHIQISAAAGSWGPEDVSVQDEDDGTTTITVMPTGTLSLSAASAIP